MTNKIQNSPKQILIPAMIALAAAIGLLAGHKMNFKNNDLALMKVSQENGTEIQKGGRIEEILRFIESNYVDTLNQNVIAVDAINHILKQLDPHSSYITPEEYDDHNEKMEGVYKGIGIETLKLRDTFYVLDIKDGSPADESELSIGDAIITIEGDTVSGNDTSYKSMSQKLKREDNGLVKLGFKSLEKNKVLSLNIKPDKITIYSVYDSYKLNDNTAYINISRFNSNTYRQFLKSLEKLTTPTEKINLVIDLRDNPGGYLPEAINILSQLFPDRDQLLTYTKGLNRKKQEYRSTGKPFYEIDKIAVLINGNSASGSEIIAGAIQDWDRGFIIGEPSYGKGLVQEIFPLNNGGALRLTVAKYYTPSERLIQKSYENITNDFVADTSSFKTKILQRDINGGGGIFPDFEIEDIFNQSCYQLYEYSDYFILNQFIRNQSTELTKSQISEDLFVQFIKDEFGYDATGLSEDCTMDTNVYLWASYQRIIDSRIAFSKILNENDPQIRKALDVIGDKKSTLALLSDED